MKTNTYSIISIIVFALVISVAAGLVAHSTAATEHNNSQSTDLKSNTATQPRQEVQVNTDNTANSQISIPALQELATKDPRAAYDLSLRYFRGDGVHQDSYQALQTMRDAAERGVLEAQKALGMLYMTGLEEMGSDLQEAQKWLAIAAARGDKEASEYLEKVTSARENEEKFYTYSRYLHPFTYRYWYHDSLYKLYWRRGYWRYY